MLTLVPAQNALPEPVFRRHWAFRFRAPRFLRGALVLPVGSFQPEEPENLLGREPGGPECLAGSGATA